MAALLCRGKVYVAGDQLRQPKMHPILKQHRVMLIDENGTSLGEMNSKVALGMAEGRDLKVELVSQNSKGNSDDPMEKAIPVFKMFTGKALYEERKASRKAARSSVEIIKEVHIGTKITEHDMGNKIRHVKDVLERGKSVRVYTEVRSKGKWIVPDQFELELGKRGTLLGDVEKYLEGVGVRVNDSKHKGTKEFMLFRPTPELIKKKEEKLKEISEAAKKKKGKKSIVAENINEELLEAMNLEDLEEGITGDKQNETEPL